MPVMHLLAVHIFAVFFAIHNGIHDVPAVNSFTRHNSTKDEQHKFHSSNFVMKLCFVVAIMVLPIAFIAKPSTNDMLQCFISGICAGLTIWVVFDPVVATNRYNRQKWYYLSTGNNVDRFLLNLFGEKAGIYKTFICLAINIGLIFLYLNLG